MAFQQNVDTEDLQLRRGSVDLAYQGGFSNEGQTGPGTGVHGEGYPSYDSSSVKCIMASRQSSTCVIPLLAP